MKHFFKKRLIDQNKKAKVLNIIFIAFLDYLLIIFCGYFSSLYYKLYKLLIINNKNIDLNNILTNIK